MSGTVECSRMARRFADHPDRTVSMLGELAREAHDQAVHYHDRADRYEARGYGTAARADLNGARTWRAKAEAYHHAAALVATAAQR